MSINLSAIALGAGRATAKSGREVVDIITFVEASWGLNMPLYPVQRVILKTFYGLPLDDNPLGFPLDVPVPPDHPNYAPEHVDQDGYYRHRVAITDWRRENLKCLTEKQYLTYLHAQRRCNIPEVEVGVERSEIVLSVGRRSGKSEMSAFISAYETYRLISKGNPQQYYGLPPGENIQVISFATDKEQASVSFGKSSGYFSGCDFFRSYAANHTKTYITFQTPSDIERFGSYADDDTAKASIKITFRSSVAKGARGSGNIVVVLDEMAHFTDNGQSSAEEVYKAVKASMAAFTKKDPKDKRRAVGDPESKMVAISSPNGRQGVFYQIFQDGFSNREIAKTRLCIQAPTWEVNPSVATSVFVTEYVRDARAFFSEFGADFSTNTREWIEDRRDLLKCVDPLHRPRFRAPAKQPHFLGLDFALQGDGTALAIGHVEDDRVVTDVVDLLIAGEGDYEDQDRLEFADVVDWIYDYTKRFYIVDGMFDQYSGALFEQLLMEKGIRQLKRVVHTAQLKSQMFSNFKDLMFDERIVLYDWPIPTDQEHCPYILELLDLQVTYKSKHLFEVEAPPVQGKHDDMSDALVRMSWLATQYMSKRKFSGPSRPVSNDVPLQLPGGLRIPRSAAVPNSTMVSNRLKARQSGSSEERQIPLPNQASFGTRARGGGGRRGKPASGLPPFWRNS